MQEGKSLYKKNWIWLSLILILGFILRIWGINKPEGLWFDEYITYKLAALPFPGEMIKGIISENCHAPLHYFFLRIWMTLFGESDFALRMSSLFTGTLIIPIMYMAGKELDNKKTGIIAALFIAINSFAIYFSQEMRIYSLIALFSSLALLAIIKIVKKPSSKSFIIFSIANLGILYTHTIGFVFVFWEILFLGIYLYLTNKKSLKPLLIACCAIFVFYLPYMIALYTHLTLGSKIFVQWWNKFSPAKLIYLITDFFSPILINLVSSPEKFISFVFNTKGINYPFIIFAILPSLIALTGIINAIKYKKLNTFLTLTGIGTICIMTIAAVMGKMVFLSKYAIEIMPILVLLCAYGLVKINNKTISKILITVFAGINLFYLASSPESAPKRPRPEGHNIVGKFLQYNNLTPEDTVFTIYYENSLFDKYFNSSQTKTFFIDKYNFINYLSDKNIPLAEAVKNGHSIYQEEFTSNDISSFTNKIDKEVISNMKPGSKLILVNLKSVSFLSNSQIQSIASNENIYENVQLLFLVFSKIKHDSLAILSKNLKFKGVYEKGRWEFYVFEK